MNRRHFLQAAPGLAAPFLLVRRAKAAEVLRIGDQRGGLKSVMQASGQLAGTDDRFAWNIFGAAAPLLEALNADALDVGGIGDAPFAFARGAGALVKAIGATRSSGASTALLVRSDAPYRSFADLKGKTIGTGRGSVGHFLVMAARARAGLGPGDIRLAFLQPSDGKPALANGSIDGWATWSQYVFLAVKQDNARIVIDGRGLMSGLSYTLATEKAIDAKRELLLDFTRRAVIAQRWGLEHLDAYASIWSRETGVPVDVSRLTLEARGFKPVRIDDTVVRDQQNTVDLYAQERVLPRRYDVSEAFDRSFNEP
jgi:sulfonate transport system substrate-binding protein